MGCWLCKSNPDGAVQNSQLNERERKTYSWDKRDRVNPADFTIEQVQHGEAGRTPGSVCGQQFIVRDCSNAHIFVLDHTNTVTVDDCNDCVIILGPTSGSVFIRQCTSCVIVAACGQFRTRDCRGLDVRLLCASQPIIESSTRVRMTCYQLHYKQLPAQLEAAGLSPFNNNWADVHDFTPVDGERNWSVVMPAVLPDLPVPLTQPLASVGVSCSPALSCVPFTLGSPSPPSHRCMHDAPLLLLLYHSDDQRLQAARAIRHLQDAAGLSAVLCTRELRLSIDDAARLLGHSVVALDGPRLTAGLVVGLLVDAPYSAMQQSIVDVRQDLVYLAPNNGIGYNQANQFFSMAGLSSMGF